MSCVVGGSKAKRTAQRIANDITNAGVTSANRQVLGDLDTGREEKYRRKSARRADPRQCETETER